MNKDAVSYKKSGNLTKRNPYRPEWFLKQRHYVIYYDPSNYSEMSGIGWDYTFLRTILQDVQNREKK